MKAKRCLSLLMGTLIATAAMTAAAGDAPPMPGPETDALASARSLIAAHNWPAALAELQRVNTPRSADWNNLMGYTLRKKKAPDYAAAERYYSEALRIEPQHRGALEYSGELYLMMDKPALAEARLQTLGAACAKRCEEYEDLAKAVAAYKKAH